MATTHQAATNHTYTHTHTHAPPPHTHARPPARLAPTLHGCLVAAQAGLERVHVHRELLRLGQHGGVAQVGCGLEGALAHVQRLTRLGGWGGAGRSRRACGAVGWAGGWVGGWGGKFVGLIISMDLRQAGKGCGGEGCACDGCARMDSGQRGKGRTGERELTGWRRGQSVGSEPLAHSATVKARVNGMPASNWRRFKVENDPELAKIYK